MADMTCQLNSDPAQLASVRRMIRHWAADRALSAARVERLLLACGEALSNAIEHAYAGDASGVVEVCLRMQGDGAVSVEIRDFGRWGQTRSPSARNGQRGRGLALMRAVMSRVEVSSGPRGTTVVMVDRRVDGAT